MEDQQTALIMRMMLATAKLSGIKPKDLAEVIANNGAKGYSLEVYHYLSKIDRRT